MDIRIYLFVDVELIALHAYMLNIFFFNKNFSGKVHLSYISPYVNS